MAKSQSPRQPLTPTKKKKKKFSFFTFPGEIRNMIYEYSLDWPDSRSLYLQYNRQIDHHYARLHAGIRDEFPEYSGELRTPTILLLCKAITIECRPILQSRKLIIDRLPPWIPGTRLPMPLTRFIGERTLQAVKYLEIRFTLGHGDLGSGWVWSSLIDDLINILLDRNSFEELRFVICMTRMTDSAVWRDEARYFAEIQERIAQLDYQNPTFWAPGRIEQEHWVVEHRRAYRIHLVGKEDNDGVVLETVDYPHEKIWPGCLLEFV